MMCGKAIWILVLMVMAYGSELGASEMSCAQAITSLLPCQPFLTGTGSSVPYACCDAAVALSKAAASNRAEMKTLCNCLKQAAAAMGVNTDRAKQIPQLCNIAVPVPIDPNVNCDR